MKRYALALLLFGLVFSVYIPQSTQAQITGYYFRRSWGGEAGQFRSPTGVAIGGNGLIYVANTNLNRIEIIDPTNRTFKILGGSSGLSNLIYEPECLAVDKSGNIYVSGPKSYERKILKISPDGTLLNWWVYTGPYGRVKGIAADENGYIYVADNGCHCIKKFTTDGDYLTQWGSLGNANGQFNSPSGIAVDGNGNVYVADTNNYRIQSFRSDGTFLRTWGEPGSGNGQFNHPVGIAVDANNNIYVTEDLNHRLQKFNSQGVYISKVGVKGSGERQFDTPMGIAVDSNGNLFVAEIGNDRIQKLSSNFIYRTQWASWDNGNGQFDYPGGIAVDSVGNFYVADTNNHRIRKFNSNWVPVLDWGSEGDGIGQFNRPRDVAIDRFGNIYVADLLNHRIQKFNSNGSYLYQWSQNMTGPWGVGTDKNAHVYVADIGNNASYQYSLDGVYQMELTANADTRDVAVDGSGNIYVVDDVTISVFSATGTLLKEWSNSGSGDGEFNEKESIAIDELGNIFVVDSAHDRIQILDSDGNFLYKWGSEGNGVGQFRWPSGIALGMDGTVFVSDKENGRVQVFAPGLPTPDPYSGAVQNGEFERILEDEWTYGGTLPVTRSTHAVQGNYSMQLGREVVATEQGEGQAWAHTTLYIPIDWDRPMLSFKYNMYVNDIMDYSDFFVAVQDGVGLNHLATVLRDGYQPCTPGIAPAAGTNLGWRTATYDLSAFKGQHIRLVFSNRNLWPGSWGIWTYVDDVRVINAGPAPVPSGDSLVYLPVITSAKHCDAVPAGSLEVEAMPRILPEP